MVATDVTAVAQWLDRIADEIRSELEPQRLAALRIVGIHTGGVRVAQALHQRLAPTPPLATLDISFYRDDFTRVGLHPRVRRSRLPVSLDDSDVLLVDDVLYSGRTVRAALNELFDYGRPRRVMLAVVIERTGRELPIRADCVGQRIDLDPSQRVRLNDADLGLRIETTDTGASQHG